MPSSGATARSLTGRTPSRLVNIRSGRQTRRARPRGFSGRSGRVGPGAAARPGIPLRAVCAGCGAGRAGMGSAGWPGRCAARPSAVGTVVRTAPCQPQCGGPRGVPGRATTRIARRRAGCQHGATNGQASQSVLYRHVSAGRAMMRPGGWGMRFATVPSRTGHGACRRRHRGGRRQRRLPPSPSGQRIGQPAGVMSVSAGGLRSERCSSASARQACFCILPGMGWTNTASPSFQMMK